MNDRAHHSQPLHKLIAFSLTPALSRWERGSWGAHAPRVFVSASRRNAPRRNAEAIKRHGRGMRQPGATPRECNAPISSSPEGAAHVSGRQSSCAAPSGLHFFAGVFLGRCSRLIWGRAFGAFGEAALPRCATVQCYAEFAVASFSLASGRGFGSLGAQHEFYETYSLVHSRLRFEFFRFGGEETGEGFYLGRSIEYGGQGRD